MANLSRTAVFWSAALLILCGVRLSEAVTWNVKKFVNANLTAVHGHPADLPAPCTAAGVCSPYTISNLPNGTIWYWCGWKSQQRTQYWVNSTGAPVSVLLMRQSELTGCAMVNSTGIKYCGQIDTSLCDTLNTCYTRVIGQVFPDDVCLLIANNDKKANATNVMVTMIQYYDSPRYYGTVFTIFITIIFCISMLTFMGISCRRQYCGPTHRLDELQTLLRLDTTATTYKADTLGLQDSIVEDDLKGTPGCAGRFRYQLDAIKVTLKQGVSNVGVKLSARNKDGNGAGAEERRDD